MTAPRCHNPGSGERPRRGDPDRGSPHDARRGHRDALVARNGELLGTITDRDMVARAVADGLDPQGAPVEHCLSPDLVVGGADDQAGDVIAVVRDRAIRRVPVTEAGRLVGIVSLGDLARQSGPGSALADMSAAPSNS